MTTIELEQVIRDYILSTYKKEYTDKMYIKKLDPVGYSIQLELGMRYKPITIYAELEDKEFLKFLKQELKDKRFNLIYYGKLDLVNKYDCNPTNSPCGCNDKGRTDRKN